MKGNGAKDDFAGLLQVTVVFQGQSPKAGKNPQPEYFSDTDAKNARKPLKDLVSGQRSSNSRGD